MVVNESNLRNCVWGSPIYVLDKVIADGKKLPLRKPKSSRRMFVGLSDRHSTRSPLVLNFDTGFISPQYHVVHNDQFATVPSNPEGILDFISEIWKELFGNATHCLDKVIDASEDPSSGDANQVEDMTQMTQPSRSLDVPQLPTTSG